MPGGTTVPYKKTKHKTFNAFCRKRFSGQYPIQSRNWGNANQGAMVLVLGKSSSQTVMFFSEEVVWGTKYAEKNKCTLIRKILLLAGQTLQINMKIKKKNAYTPPILKGGATCCMQIHVKAGTGRAERGHGVTGWALPYMQTCLSFCKMPSSVRFLTK